MLDFTSQGKQAIVVLIFLHVDFGSFIVCVFVFSYTTDRKLVIILGFSPHHCNPGKTCFHVAHACDFLYDPYIVPDGTSVALNTRKIQLNLNDSSIPLVPVVHEHTLMLQLTCCILNRVLSRMGILLTVLQCFLRD